MEIEERYKEYCLGKTHNGVDVIGLIPIDTHREFEEQWEVLIVIAKLLEYEIKYYSQTCENIVEFINIDKTVYVDLVFYMERDLVEGLNNISIYSYGAVDLKEKVNCRKDIMKAIEKIKELI